jgi:hypothetical protein
MTRGIARVSKLVYIYIYNQLRPIFTGITKSPLDPSLLEEDICFFFFILRINHI